MARYVSRAQAFKKSVVKAELREIATPYGMQQREATAPIIAIFQQGGATPREVKLALERFQFKGLAEGENPARRLSVYDTDEEARRCHWPEAVKAQVEATLDAGQSTDYFRVDEERAPKPWPAYDETAAGKVLEVARSAGVPLADVLAYETENQNRKTVLAAVEAELGKVAIAA